MRDYQRQKGNKYILPRAVYNQTLWIIRDYQRMKEEAQAILVESPAPPDGMPKGTGTGDEVFRKAMERDDYIMKIRAIDKSLALIPAEYRKGVWNNITRYDRYPSDASRSTYAEQKSKFVFAVAVELNIF